MLSIAYVYQDDNEPCSPALQQVCHFASWRQFVAHAVRVDIFHFWHIFSSDDGVVWVHHMPDTRYSARLLLAVDKTTWYFGLARQMFSFAKVFFRLLVFKVWIDYLKHARNAARFRLA